MIKIGFLILLTCFSIPFSVFSEPGAIKEYVDYAYFRKADALDLGTIHLFVRNITEKALSVTRISLNGKDLLDMPSEQAMWWQVVPFSAKPGETLDVMVKVRAPAEKYQIKVFLNNGEQTSAEVVPVSPVLKFSYIGYSGKFDRVYLYIENTGQAVLKIEKVYCGTKEITGNCFIPEAVIRPQAKALAIYTPEKPFGMEQRPVFKVTTDRGVTAAAVSKVYSHFPIMTFGNDPRPEMGFDSGKFELTPAGSASGKSAVEQMMLDDAEMFASDNAFYHVLGSPSRQDTNASVMIGTNVKKVIEISRTCYKVNPEAPSFIYVGEPEKPRSYFIYGETTDIMAVDPYEIIYYHNPPEKDAYYTKLAKLACEPRPLWTIPEAFTYKGTRCPTPEEERIIVYSEIGEGSKGIWYFLYDQKTGYPSSPPLEKEIGLLNKELGLLRNYLVIGEPVSIATVNADKVTPYALLCGDKGIVVILVNNDHQSNFEEGKTPFMYRPRKDLKVQVAIPSWMKVRQVKEISGGEGKEAVYSCGKDGGLILPIDKLDITRQFLILAADPR